MEKILLEEISDCVQIFKYKIYSRLYGLTQELVRIALFFFQLEVIFNIILIYISFRWRIMLL